MTAFIAPSILIGGKEAIKVKDNFPVLVQSYRQSLGEGGEASTWPGGRFRQALASSGAEAGMALEKLVFGECFHVSGRLDS